MKRFADMLKIMPKVKPKPNTGNSLKINRSFSTLSSTLPKQKSSYHNLIGSGVYRSFSTSNLSDKSKFSLFTDSKPDENDKIKKEIIDHIKEDVKIGPTVLEKIKEYEEKVGEISIHLITGLSNSKGSISSVPVGRNIQIYKGHSSELMTATFLQEFGHLYRRDVLKKDLTDPIEEYIAEVEDRKLQAEYLAELKDQGFKLLSPSDLALIAADKSGTTDQYVAERYSELFDKAKTKLAEVFEGTKRGFKMAIEGVKRTSDALDTSTYKIPGIDLDKVKTGEQIVTDKDIEASARQKLCNKYGEKHVDFLLKHAALKIENKSDLGKTSTIRYNKQ